MKAALAIVAMISLAGCTTRQEAQAAPPQRLQSPKGETIGIAGRKITFNRRPLTRADAKILQQLEAQSGQRTPDGDYWYDAKSGAAGKWGGPATVILPAGLSLGGPLPANASGGGTRVFINGREIHPIDRYRLQQLLGRPVMPGRYWVDAQGNGGLEGGPAIVNLYAAARQQGGGGSGGGRDWTYHSDGLTGRSRDNINGASDGQTTCYTAAGRTYCNDGNN
jgi:hypothetical protein